MVIPADAQLIEISDSSDQEENIQYCKLSALDKYNLKKKGRAEEKQTIKTLVGKEADESHYRYVNKENKLNFKEDLEKFIRNNPKIGISEEQVSLFFNYDGKQRKFLPKSKKDIKANFEGSKLKIGSNLAMLLDIQ